MNIVFAGGGTKGIVYIGILKKIQTDEIKIANYYGTSIGGLFGLCGCINLNHTLLVEIMMLKYKNLKPCTSITNLLNFYGTDTGEKLEDTIKELLALKNLKSSISFIELYEYTKTGLFIISSDVQNHCIKRFNYVDTPDFQVSTAILSSMSLPIVFKPVLGRYIDGALLCNFPILEAPNTPETIGFYFNGKKTNYQDNLVSYITNIFSCITNAQLPFPDKRRVYEISLAMNSLSFDLEMDQLNKLIDKGYSIMNDLLLNIPDTTFSPKD